jgi:hypothetical protein
MRVLAIAKDGVQKRTQDSHSAFNEEKCFEPEVAAVAENADEDGNCDGKYHEQPDVVEHRSSRMNRPRTRAGDSAGLSSSCRSGPVRNCSVITGLSDSTLSQSHKNSKMISESRSRRHDLN